MIPEVACRACNGEGRIECEGIHPKRFPGSVSIMEQPDSWTERCDGSGKVEDERRENFDAREAINRVQEIHRSVIVDLLRDAERLDADRLRRIEALIAENRMLRERLAAFGRTA